MNSKIDAIVDLVLKEASARYADEKAEHGCMGSMASKIHSVMMDVALRLGDGMERVSGACVEEE